MIWIVTILATLMYLGFGVIYAAGFSKRKHFRWSMLITAAAIFLTQAGMFFWLQAENYVGATIWMGLGYILMMLALWVNVRITWTVASYYAVWASCTWYLAYEVSMVCCYLLNKRWGIPTSVFPAVLFLVGAIGVIVCRYTVAIWIPEDKRFLIGPRQLTSALVLLGMQGYLFLWFVEQCSGIQNELLQGGDWFGILQMQILCVVVLYLQNELFKKSAMRQARLVSDLLWRQQKEHYRIAKENIDIINRKCHDLKHQISALRDMCTKEEREKYIEEIQDSIQIYEAMVKTGNDVLDTILTEKSLACKANNIVVSCVADGEGLEFLHPVDLYTIFGNAMDNAIECVKHFKEKEKRQIDVLIHRQHQFLIVQIMNPVERELEFEDNLPVTTKHDKDYHGYGLRSIKNTVKKYNGVFQVKIKDGCFCLKILFPVKKEWEKVPMD